MSQYRVCKMKIGQEDAIEHMNFDNKEDAEHHAKNISVNDVEHRYEIQKNDHGEFSTIKAYENGQIM